MTGVDQLDSQVVDGTPRDLTTYTPPPNVAFAVHDGSSATTEGLYWRDETNTRWVKVSTNAPSSSTTIDVNL